MTVSLIDQWFCHSTDNRERSIEDRSFDCSKGYWKSLTMPTNLSGSSPSFQVTVYLWISKRRRQRERLREGKLMDYSERMFDSTVTTFHKFFLPFALCGAYTSRKVRCFPIPIYVLTGLIGVNRRIHLALGDISQIRRISAFSKIISV